MLISSWIMWGDSVVYLSTGRLTYDNRVGDMWLTHSILWAQGILLSHTSPFMLVTAV